MVEKLAFSTYVVHRWAERRSEIAPRSQIGVFLDERIDDNRMEKIYSNMEFIK